MNEKQRKVIRENHYLWPDKEVGPYIMCNKPNVQFEIELDPKEIFGEKRYEEVMLGEDEVKSFRYSEIVEALKGSVKKESNE